MSEPWRGVIQSKLCPPPLPDRLVPRPRLEQTVARLLERHGVLTVCATAGAGKTTAIAQAVATVQRPVAWLTLDDTDAAPGRLLTYLEAAIARRIPDVGGTATGAMAVGTPHREAAGLLAEAIGDVPLLLVLDELERLAEAPDALAVIASLVRYAPAELRLVLVSRRELGLDARLPRCAALGERELAFTYGEAAQALEQTEGGAVDPKRAVDVTGGWVTGVLFEAWRSAEHVAGIGGEADPLHGYLSTQILGQLPSEDREFLVSTAVLDRVTIPRSEALGLRDAGVRMASLRTRRLPLTWLADGREMRCHTRFREYLLACLGDRSEHRLRALHTAHARVLLAEGHPEEAIEELLVARARAEARPLIAQAIGSVVERLDYPVAERWLSAVQPSEHGAGDLALGELMLAIGQQQYRRGAAVGDRLAAAGLRESTLRSSGRAACMLAWCYWHVGRLAEARAVAEATGPGPLQPVLSYLLSLCYDDVAEPPPLTDGPLDALLIRLHWAHGSFDQLRRAPVSRWAAAVADPLRISALLAIGQTDEAAELSAGCGDANWLEVMAAVELLAELGRHDEAWTRLESGRALIPPTGSVVLDGLSRQLEARLHLGLGDPEAALRVIDALEADPALRAYRFVIELAGTWRGLALLQRDDAAGALHVLRATVASMRAGDRILELPRAAIYLSDAEWRAGDEAAADAAARLALETAQRQGSTHRVLQALGDVPEVAARAIDAEADRDAPWHELGRRLLARPTPRPAAAAVKLREFGELSIVHGGEELRPRIRKSRELLAYLVDRESSASRDELLDALFDGRDDSSARAYLRQAIRQLTAVLPAEAELAVGPQRVALAPDASVTSESVCFERLLSRAADADGQERIALLREAIELAERGEYLPGVESAWAEERRAALARTLGDARLDAADQCFLHGRYQEARGLAERAIEDDPYSERGWRSVMSVADAVGDDDGVLSAFRACSERLAEIGLRPSSRTLALVKACRDRAA